MLVIYLLVKMNFSLFVAAVYGLYCLTGSQTNILDSVNFYKPMIMGFNNRKLSDPNRLLSIINERRTKFENLLKINRQHVSLHL